MMAARLHTAIVAGAVAFFGVVSADEVAAASRQQTRGMAGGRELLDRYCVGCHNARTATAGLALDAADPDKVADRPEIWEKVVRKLRTASMPPVRMPRPDSAAQSRFVSDLERALDDVVATRPNPGRPTLHRLNRTEYVNAVREVLALDVDGRSLLPADESGFGFDNIADVLSMSPGLLDRYISAARRISRMAVGDQALPSAVTTYTLPRELVQDERMSDALPFGSRGGAAIHHRFGVDGEYILRVRLHRVYNQNIIRGLERAQELDLRIDGARVAQFSVGGGPGSGQGAAPQPLAEYQRSADEGLKVRVAVKAGTRPVAVVFRQHKGETEGVGPDRLPPSSISFNADQRAEMSIASIEIEGPIGATSVGETPSRRRLFVCRPRSVAEERPCARTIISALARRAYRRPADPGAVKTLLNFYETGRRKGGFESGIRFAVERALVSPDFLFRVETDPPDAPPGTAYRVDDLALASRLSFFLWSGPPDDELVDAAERGTLRNGPVLEQQVRRMLADGRSMALITNFAAQWLHVRNVRLAAPDPHTFPEFDLNLRDALQQETELFLRDQLRQDRPVGDLLTADYTFINERLARHYGIPSVYGGHFRKVMLPDDQRVGLLGHGSVLTVTSYSTRTSPVLRGKWILENVLGVPPPPPPPNVPALNDEKQGEPATVRERLELHRKNPACASCHSRMDPLGFALENFDAIGRWRTTDAGHRVDASGTLPDGTTFDGPREFRKALQRHQDEFASTITEKLLTYALGRGLEYYDMPAIRAVMRDAARTDYRWSSLILGIVRSVPFQMKRSAEP